MKKNCLRCGKVFTKLENESRKYWAIKKYCSNRCGQLGRVVSKETRIKKRDKMLGKLFPPRTPEQIEKNRQSHIGLRRSVETRQKMKESQLKRVKEGRHNNYKGGVSTTNKKIRDSLEYRLWRESVFERDNWTCVWCGAKSQKGKSVTLHADHIKPFAYFPDLRFDINNGRTLCKECHTKTDTFSWKAYNKFKVQSITF